MAVDSNYVTLDSSWGTLAMPATTKVEIRGEEFEINQPIDGVSVLCCALLALKDPKVDKVLRAFQVRFEDSKGRVIFPPGDREERSFNPRDEEE